MVDSAPHLYPSCTGDTILPSLLRTSVQTAESVVQRRTPVQAGLLSRGSRGRILNSSLPNPAWIGPEDLDKVFVAAKQIEDGLAYIRAQHADSGVPSELQRDLLEEACSPSELQATANLRGSRLDATEVDGELLVAHATGQIGEQLRLSVLGRTSEGDLQGKAQSCTQAAGSHILQLSWNKPARSQDRLLLACRTSHWICVFEASREADGSSSSLSGEPEEGLAWTLKPVAAHQTAVRISHMAWNPQLPSLLGFVCEDGSLHLADADSEVGDARQIGLGGGTFPLMQAHVVDATGKEATRQKHARLVCEWGLHPLTLLLAAGAHLVRYDIRKPGAGCAPRPIHTLPEGDAFVALAPMCLATSARQDRHLLAASTLHCVMLLDLRRPQQALLKWPHGSRREPPQLLSMYCSAVPEVSRADPDVLPTHESSQQQDTPLESTLQGSAADADDDQSAKAPSDVLASHYGSSSQYHSSQRPLSQVKLKHMPGMLGTQASQAAPAEPLRTPLADAADPWPVSWHASASDSPQSNLGPRLQSTESSTMAEGLQGRICAAGMGSGDVLLHSFACSAPEVEVHAWPPAGSQAGTSSDAGQPAVGSIKVTPMASAQRAASQPDQEDGEQAQRSVPGRGPPEQQEGQHRAGNGAKDSSAGFIWRPARMTATYAQGLPRRICWPLKAVERVDAGLEGLAPDLVQQLEEVHREGPDLCGMAVVPPGAASGNRGATLLRLGFLGHVSAQRFADPMAQPDPQQAQQQPADAVYDIFPPSSASAGGAAAPQSKRDGQNSSLPGQRLRPHVWSERDSLCSMSGHHAIAQAALQAPAADCESAAEVSEQTRDALSSLLQETEVPLSLWEAAQELGREGIGQRAAKDLSMYRRRVGSILEGVPVIDYTTEGSRASRLQRWEKLQTDLEGLAAARFQQALSEASGGDGALYSDPTRLRSAVADIAAAATEGASGNKQALQLREGLSLPRQSTLADARPAAQGSSAAQRMQTPILGSQFSSLAATQSQGSPAVQQSTAALIPLNRSCGTSDILYPISQSRSQDAAHEGSQPAQMTLHMTKPEAADEAARSALKEMEEEWAEFEGRLSGKDPSKIPAPPRFSDTQTPGQGDGGAGTRRSSAAAQPSGLRKVKRPGESLGSQAKARKGSTAGRPSMPFEEGFS